MRDMLIISDRDGKPLCYLRTHEQLVRFWDFVETISLDVRHGWKVTAIRGWGDKPWLES